jgi:hypothetical protein
LKETTQPSVQWVSFFFLEVKRPERGVDTHPHVVRG